MNTIGLLGGMSWESSQLYYQLINRVVRAAHPDDGLTSAPIILDSIDFAPMARLQRENRWDEAGQFLAQRAQMLEAAGAQVLGLCTNTMHKVFDVITSAVSIPMIHIANPTIAALHSAKISRVAFLGTRFSMSERFLADVYAAQGIELLMPTIEQQELVHGVIMSELCQGVVTKAARAQYISIINELQRNGAQALILGCTEITLLIQASHTDLALFDSTELHAQALAAACIKL